MLNKVLKKFCRETNIHGFGYIFQSSRNKTEQIFWILSILISFILTGVLIYKLITENQKNPTIIYTDQNVVNIQNIDFPAVTMCLGLVYTTDCRTPVDYDLIVSLLQENKSNIENLTLDELKLMQIVSLFTTDQFLSANFPSLHIPTVDFMDKLEIYNKMVPVNDTQNKPIDLIWLNKYVLDAVHVLARYGYCFTFNMPPIEDIYRPQSVMYNFSKNRVYEFDMANKIDVLEDDLKTPYPQKCRGRDEGLFIEFDSTFRCYHPNGTKGNYNFLLNSFVDPLKLGFLIKIHSPYEVLSKSSRNIYLRYYRHKSLTISPKISKIDENLVDAPIYERNCYLQHERQLEFFKVYNKVNCEHECLAQMTLDSCKCVQFFMARNHTTKICGIADEKCFQEVENQFDIVKSACKCYDSCENVKYEVEFKSEGQLYTKDRLLFRTSVMTLKIDLAVDSVFATSKKKSQTAVELLSFIGGILGLFAGFSVLSGMDIIYYFILCPVTSMINRNDTRVHPLLGVNQFKSKISVFWRFVNEMLVSSSIHSFSHIGNVKNGIIERIIWLILFIFSMVMAIFMVQSVYEIYKGAKIAMNYEGSPTKVEELPFPAFTLVHDLELSIEDFFLDNITRLDHNDEIYYETVFSQLISTICSRSAYIYKIDKMSFRSNTDLIDVLNYYDFYQPPWFASRNATWNGHDDPYFAKVLTSTAYGYTFNLIEQSKLLNEHEVSEEFYYSYGKDNNPNYPWMSSSGENHGFRLEVNMSFTYVVYVRDTCIRRDAFVIHPSNELPIGIEQTSLDMNSEYLVLVSAEVVKADDDLRSLDYDIRKCYFEDERKLNFFKIYTQKNCELECFVFVVNKYCGCVPFNYVHNKSSNVCDYFTTRSCIVFYQSFINFTRHEELYSTHGVCKCLPLCSYVKYSYETHRIGFAHSAFEGTRAIIEVKWKDSEYFAMVRYQQLRLVDFVAYVGGILGLFAGISVLSIFELFYFSTLRLIMDLARFIKNRSHAINTI